MGWVASVENPVTGVATPTIDANGPVVVVAISMTSARGPKTKDLIPTTITSNSMDEDTVQRWLSTVRSPKPPLWLPVSSVQSPNLQHRWLWWLSHLF